MKRFATVTLAATAVLTSACSTTEKLAAQQPYDMQLNCAQIQSELVRTDAVLAQADKNKGVNTANVAAVLLFWPAAVGNYMNADKGENMALTRRQNLIYLGNRQGCNAGAPAMRQAYMPGGLRR